MYLLSSSRCHRGFTKTAFRTSKPGIKFICCIQAPYWGYSTLRLELSLYPVQQGGCHTLCLATLLLMGLCLSVITSMHNYFLIHLVRYGHFQLKSTVKHMMPCHWCFSMTLCHQYELCTGKNIRHLANSGIIKNKTEVSWIRLIYIHPGRIILRVKYVISTKYRGEKWWRPNIWNICGTIVRRWGTTSGPTPPTTF